jgi:c-di-GMP-binding flagellar brake protein YcgR
MVVKEVTAGGQIALVTVDDETLPGEWQQLGAIHITTLDRYSVHLIHVPVVSADATHLVVAPPTLATSVQRRAYARVADPVPAQCVLLDEDENTWHPFAAEVRDLGGGGLSMIADTIAPGSATIALSLDLDDDVVVAVGRVLPREQLPTIGKPMMRIEFVLIREIDRDRILGYVLQTEAKRRHRQPAS